MSKPKKNKADQKITIKYLKSEDHSTHPASGVHGGISPTGDIVASFFFEKLDTPAAETYTISELKTLSKATGKTTREVVREIMTTFVMRPETARSIAKWLNNQVDEFDKLIKSSERKG